MAEIARKMSRGKEMLGVVIAEFRKVFGRLLGWNVLTIIAVAAVLIIAPQQIGVLIYKVLQVTLGVALAYGADRALFLNADDINRDMTRDSVSAARILARAVVAFAVIIGLTVGL